MNPVIVLQSGIPVPSKKAGMFKPSKYPFPKMKPGQSFVFPLEVKPAYAHTIVYACTKAAKPARVFTVRKTFEGMRVWRVK